MDQPNWNLFLSTYAYKASEVQDDQFFEIRFSSISAFKEQEFRQCSGVGYKSVIIMQQNVIPMRCNRQKQISIISGVRTSLPFASLITLAK